VSSPAPAYATPGTSPDDAASPSSEHWLWLLWQNRRVLFACAWKTLLLATVVAFLIPVQYESTTRLVPGESSKTSLSMMSALAAKAAGGSDLDLSGLLGMKTPGAFYVSILQSRTVQDRLINRFDLRKVYGKRYYQDARKKLTSRTKISEDKKSGLIEVTVSDRSAHRAADLTRAYAEEVNRLAADLNTSEAHRERVFIENRLQAEKQELDTADKDLSEFSSKYSAIDIKEQGKAMVEAAATLQGELIAAQSQLTGLEQIYSENNVRVRSLRARAAELKQQLNKFGGEYTPAGTLTAPTKDQVYPPIRSLPALAYRYAQFYRRARIAETVYELLTRQYELAKIQEAKELPVVAVMDRAEMAERKSFPPRTVIICLSVLASILFSSLWIISRAQWNELETDDLRKRLLLEARDELAPALQSVRRYALRVWPLKKKAGSAPPDEVSDGTS